MNSGLYIGMISGTSRDGVDTALVRFAPDELRLVASACLPYPPDLAAALARIVCTGKRPSSKELAELDPAVAAHFSQAALALLQQAGIATEEITAIGSHGQTVWHQPEEPNPESIQLGSPSHIAARTGITTIGNFRQADLEAGGQGAPLAPLLHRAMLQPKRSVRVVLNLGGIANISVLHPDASVQGYDTGPANCLLDAWIQARKNMGFDRNGTWAAGGRVDPTLLTTLLADPYFQRPPPKSTGVEYFNLDWLQRMLPAKIEAQDVQATLSELTAASVAAAIAPHQPADVLVCGGGLHNHDLIGRIRNRLAGVSLGSTADHGLDPDWVEAILFAWLARERLAGLPLETGPITGAHRSVLLGAIAHPGPQEPG